MIRIILIVLVCFTTSYAEELFKIGIIAPFSGPLAEYGLACKNGIELAKEQHPEHFANIEFIFEDSQWDSKMAVSAFNTLRTDKQVSLIYNWGNPTTEAIAPISDKYQMPLVGMTLDPAVTYGRKYIIRATNSAADFSAALARFIEKNNFKKVGVVISDNTYVRGLYQGIEKSLDKKITIEIIDNYQLSDQDFRTSVSKIRSKKYDLLGVFLITGQVSTFYRQLSDQGIKLPTFGTDFFESTTEIKLSRGGMNGAVYPHLGTTAEFREDYTKKYKNDYQLSYAGNGYDMAVVFGKLFNTLTTKLSSDQVLEKLRSAKNEAGVGGEFSYQDNEKDGPHFHFPVQLKKIVDEQIISAN